MGMKIAEFFAELGVEGAEKSVQAVDSVTSEMGKLQGMTLEAKAAIVGVFYGLEQMFSASNRTGTALANFRNLTGLSTQELQKYQYAMRQIGGTNEDVQSTFQNLQSVVAKALMGQGVPKGIGLIAPTVGLTNEQFWGAMKDPAQLFQMLQKFARSNVAPAIRNEILKGFGLSDTMISGMVQNAFRPDVMARAQIYTDRETNALQKNAAAWGNLGTKIEMAFGKFNAIHGGGIVKDIGMITDSILNLVNALTKLAEKLKVFKGLDLSSTGIADIINTVSGSGTPLPGQGGASYQSPADLVKGLYNLYFPPSNEGNKNGVPSVNLTQHFHDKVDPQKAGDSAKRGVEQAFRQLQAGTAGN